MRIKRRWIFSEGGWHYIQKAAERVQANFNFYQNKRDQRTGWARGKHLNDTLWIPKQHQRCTRLQVQGQQKFSQFQKSAIKTTTMESSPNSCVISVTTTFDSFTVCYMDGELSNEGHQSSAGCTYSYFRSSFVIPFCFSSKLSRSQKQSWIK